MPTTRHNILLREGDFDYLKAAHPQLSATAVVRQLVSAHVDKMRATVPQVNIHIPQEDIERV